MGLWVGMASISAVPQPEPGAFEDAIRKAAPGFWGAALVAADGKPLFARGYGFEHDGAEPITADSLFDIGSISKMFTAAALLRLQEQGVLSLDDPLSKHLPLAGAAATDITLRHLLTHTAGTDDDHGMVSIGHPDRDDAVRRGVAARRAAPGASFRYSNVGYSMLAAVVEEAAGEPFAGAMQRLVFKPAGMAHTGFITGEGLDPDRYTTRRTTFRGPSAALVDMSAEPLGWGLLGAGGVATSLNDLIVWDRALTGDDFLSPDSKAEFFRPNLGRYALGWFIGSTDRGTAEHSHGGGTRGYRCVLTRYPDEGVVIAVLTNDQFAPHAVATALAEVMWPPRPDDSRVEFTLPNANLNEHGYREWKEGWTFGVADGEGEDEGRIVVVLSRETGETLVRLSLGLATAASLSRRVAEEAAGANPAGPTGRSLTIATQPTSPTASSCDCPRDWSGE